VSGERGDEQGEMGQCLSSEQDLTEEGKKAKLQSAKIDRDLYEYAKREMNVVKILMLGKSLFLSITLHSMGFIDMGTYVYIAKASEIGKQKRK
jgi:hypothetical protein